MSRVAKNPVLIPDNVKLAVENNKVIVEGPKGKDELTINKDISVVQEDSSVTIKYDESISTQVAIAGTTRALINNMVIGVNIGFEKKLELVGVGYRAKLNGNTLDLTLGFSHPIKHQLPENVTAETPSQTEIILKSHNKQLLGQTAAEIRAYRPPEPYKGKGVKYADEQIKRKEAKKAAGAGA
ncbi:50S ribosomal protein L6 [Gammaproteobacteria bacterium]|jgi:large subunit ribosomal protein L6|nr:50S ribosomal protein L6 [Gammaproteobacteria bacterium]GIS26360.1 MAG: 50S ribosomal protein L6 [Gammaproteobacteria bacterium]|tara:strand:- start:256 stop:804 length:549 start_codon:yes stop_codon:yes gene_type:complete